MPKVATKVHVEDSPPRGRALSLDMIGSSRQLLLGQPQPQPMPQPSPLFPGSPFGKVVEVREDTYAEVAPGITRMLHPAYDSPGLTIRRLGDSQTASLSTAPDSKPESPCSYAIRWQEVEADSLTADVLRHRRNTLVGFEGSLSEALCRLGPAATDKVVEKIIQLDPDSLVRAESNPRWCGNFPLHFAIERECPLQIIVSLLATDAGRAITNEPNTAGLLPLHHALCNPSKRPGHTVAVVTTLIDANPDSVWVEVAKPPYHTPTELAMNAVDDDALSVNLTRILEERMQVQGSTGSLMATGDGFSADNDEQKTGGASISSSCGAGVTVDTNLATAATTDRVLLSRVEAAPPIGRETLIPTSVPSPAHSSSGGGGSSRGSARRASGSSASGAERRKLVAVAEELKEEHQQKAYHISFMSSLVAGFAYSGLTSVEREEVEPSANGTPAWAAIGFVTTVLLSVCLSVVSVVLLSAVLYNVGKFDAKKFRTRKEVEAFRAMLSSMQGVAVPSFQYSVYCFLASIVFLQRIKVPMGPAGVAPSALVLIAFAAIIKVQNTFEKRALRLRHLTFKGDIVPIASPSIRVVKTDSQRRLVDADGQTTPGAPGAAGPLTSPSPLRSSKSGRTSIVRQISNRRLEVKWPQSSHQLF